MPAAHKAQRIEEVRAGGVAGNDSSGVTRLSAHEGGKVLRAGRGSEVQIEGIEIRPLKFIQHTGGKNASLPSPLAHQGNLARPVGFICQRFYIPQRDRYSVSQRIILTQLAFTGRLHF